MGYITEQELSSDIVEKLNRSSSSETIEHMISQATSKCKEFTKESLNTAKQEILQSQSNNSDNIVREFIAGEDIKKGDILTQYDQKVYINKQNKGNEIQFTTHGGHPSVCKIDDNRFIVCSNSGYGYAQILTVKGTNISKGNEIQFTTHGGHPSVCKIDDNRFIVCSNGGYAQILTVKGTNISKGNEIQFTHDGGHPSVCKIDDNRFIVCSNGGYAQILTVKGTNISKGNEMIFNSNNYYPSVCKIDDNRFIVCISNSGYGYAQILTVKGTDISKGNEIPFHGDYPSVCKIDYNRFIVCSYYNKDGNNGYAQILTVKGTNISKGNEIQFTTHGEHPSVCKIDDNRILVCSNNDDHNGYAQILTIEGADISKGNEIQFTTHGEHPSVCKIDDNRFIVCSNNDNNEHAQILTVNDMYINYYHYNLGIALKDAKLNKKVDVFINGINNSFKGLIPCQRYINNEGKLSKYSDNIPQCYKAINKVKINEPYAIALSESELMILEPVNMKGILK